MNSQEQSLSYPVPKGHVEEIGDDWHDNTMYGIAGWFSANYDAGPFTGHAAAFGGYLKLDTETGAIAGLLVDLLGFATIEGVLTEDTITFVKEYVCGFGSVTCHFPITYTFKKTHEGYAGYFNFTQDGREFHGEAFCKLQDVVSNAYGIIQGLIRDGM